VDDRRLNRETAQIDPARLSRYGLHKFLAEQLVRKYAGRWLILRLGGMVGRGLWKNSIFDMLEGKPLRVHADSRYQYLDVDDVAQIVFSLARRQPENDLFNVCGQGCIALGAVAALIPDYGLRYEGSDPRREHYEVNIAKLEAVLRVPRTQATVRAFLGGRARA
jgi:nucleoside-diphosphate-sugar epimerase